ncbi:hypothetical protein DFH09DRAFT_200170 [Mycena vulgaris]|nr:hypothetical protein DFH09DRAFT_200170 [Mycena vulgaris]
MTAAAPEEAFIWANYALVAAAVLYIYDCIITFSAEVRLVQANIMKLEGHRRLLLQFVPLRYFALFYHVTIICGVSMSELRPKLWRHPGQPSNEPGLLFPDWICLRYLMEGAFHLESKMVSFHPTGRSWSAASIDQHHRSEPFHISGMQGYTPLTRL